MTQLAIIGAGSWGTALAIVLAPRFEHVTLWAHEPGIAAGIEESRENAIFLPGFIIPTNVHATSDLATALSSGATVLSVTPSHHTRAVYQRMLPHLTPGMSIVSATKGIENGTLLRMSEVIQQVVGTSFTPRIAVLSGPTFAKEIARGEPAAVVISSEDQDLAASIQAAFSGPTLRLYTNDDPIGVELGASLKNVIAIAAGVCAGLQLGSNSVAALVTRGLAEISRLAVALGGRPRTLAGLAGLGDLVLTCNGDLSRNRRVGMELAAGRSLAEITGSMRMVAEGVETAQAAVDLSRRQSIEMPITEQMNAILRGEKSPRDAIRDLMDRSLKSE